MKILSQLCSVPTAPFAEGQVVRFAKEFVSSRKGLRMGRDEFGNVLIEQRGKSAGPRWIFTAHMDHPGFIARKMIDARTLDADFRGYVLPEYFGGEKVRFVQTDGREIKAIVKSFTVGKDRKVPVRAVLEVKGVVAPGTPGVWDQVPAQVRGKKFYSRVCDDLAGAAAALEMLDEIHRKPAKVTVGVLLTRAEEEGFIGAIAASLKPKLLRKTDRVIAIETSAMQPYAPQGNGVVVRVGDRTSVFHSALGYFINQQAEELAKKDKAFRFQRALMPGGTCEATVYDVYGFIASSICVALGNYHNMDKDAKKIAPEFIDINDWQSMVKLFVQVARTGHTFEPGHGALKKRIEKRFEKWKRFLES